MTTVHVDLEELIGLSPETVARFARVVEARRAACSIGAAAFTKRAASCASATERQSLYLAANEAVAGWFALDRLVQELRAASFSRRSSVTPPGSPARPSPA